MDNDECDTDNNTLNCERTYRKCVTASDVTIMPGTVEAEDAFTYWDSTLGNEVNKY